MYLCPNTYIPFSPSSHFLSHISHQLSPSLICLKSTIYRMCLKPAVGCCIAVEWKWRKSVEHTYGSSDDLRR